MLGTMVVLTFVTNNAYTRCQELKSSRTSVASSSADGRWAGMPEDETPFPWSLNPGDYLERRATWLLILCCSGAMLALLLLLIVTMRNRVAIAIELIEEGSVVSISTHCVYSIDNIYSIYCIYGRCLPPPRYPQVRSLRPHALHSLFSAGALPPPGPLAKRIRLDTFY